MSHYRWRLYYGRGRGQLRLGVWRHRRDRVSPEYHWVSVGFHL